MMRTCRTCGVRFKVPPHLPRKRYCSAACLDTWHRTHKAWPR